MSVPQLIIIGFCAGLLLIILLCITIIILEAIKERKEEKIKEQKEREKLIENLKLRLRISELYFELSGKILIPYIYEKEDK